MALWNTSYKFQSTKSSALAKLNLLVADADRLMSQVLQDSLKHMGFQGVQKVNDGVAALKHITNKPVDILITEWDMERMNGMDLVGNLRRADNSPNRALPIIMLTGRAEPHDVLAARDAGITEFIVKPYTSRTLFSRIELLFDHPRNFLLTANFVGPDRRRREGSPKDGTNRRTTVPKVITDINKSLQDDYYTPKLLPASPTLKHKIGLKDSITTIITPDMLIEAQKAIESFKTGAMQEIKDDLKLLEAYYIRIEKKLDRSALEPFQQALLSVKARAGTFGYHAASDAAQSLYAFLRNHFKISHTPQHIVLLKHLQAIKVLLAESILESKTGIDRELLQELKTLVSKYKMAGLDH